MSADATKILPNVVDEARRLLLAADERCVEVRAIGGVAVALHAQQDLHHALARDYRDIDLVSGRKRARDASQLLEASGYEPNQRFNALNGASRLVFYDTTYGRQIDVFVGEFRMCHVVPVGDRLHIDPVTVPLAELLLTKLQIVHQNEKDLKDIWAIVLHHGLADHDADAINSDFVAGALARDWGFWRTSRQSIEAARARLPESGLDTSDRELVDTRLAQLWERIEAEPKSLRWRSRSKIGDRTRWYDEPEEIAHGI